MSIHSYSRCWLHLVWTTLDWEPTLTTSACARASRFLTRYAGEQGIYLRANSFNAEHVHALIDLPTNKSIEQVMHLLKGSSSHWINEQRLLQGRFSWGRGYDSFSVSHSQVNQIVPYLAAQEQYHRKQTFSQEFEILVKKHGLEWHDR